VGKPLVAVTLLVRKETKNQKSPNNPAGIEVGRASL
jgi:hypothetical protein